MIKAVREVVHKGATPDEAYQTFEALKGDEEQVITVSKE
jgi:hypothetical protein